MTGPRPPYEHDNSSQQNQGFPPQHQPINPQNPPPLGRPNVYPNPLVNQPHPSPGIIPPQQARFPQPHAQPPYPPFPNQPVIPMGGVVSPNLPPTLPPQQYQNISNRPHSIDRMDQTMANVGLGPPRFGPMSSQASSAPTTSLVSSVPDADIFRQAPVSPVNPPVLTEFIRCSMSKIPKTQAILSKSKFPLGITLSPYPKNTQLTVPLINHVIVRCRRCRSYLNPYVEQIEQGARWRCNLCMLINEYPPSFDVDPATQTYVDRAKKPELNCPVYDFIAPVEYMVRDPQPPAFVFVLDASHLAVKSGMTATAVKVINDCLDSLPNENGLARMAVIAVDSAIHYFNLSLNTPEPKSLIVSDLKDSVIPCRFPDILVSVSDCRKNLEYILRKIPILFNGTQKGTVAFGSAINAACNLLAPIGGKVVGLLSSLPTIGDGALIQRDDPKLYGTPKETSMLQSANNFYKLLATEATKNQVAVDLFLFPSSYMDVASISCISKYTGGQVFLYPAFNASRPEDAVKFAADLSNFLQTEFGLEAVLRIRATQGVSVPTYHGSFFYRSSDLLALPNICQDHSYSAELSVDEALTVSHIGVQAAFLHTTCGGERRIRVINGSYPVSDDLKDLVNWIDTGATVDIMAKIAIDKVLSGKIEDGRDYLVGKLGDILTFYRVANGIGQNLQLAVCDSLKSLPYLVLGAMKSVL